MAAMFPSRVASVIASLIVALPSLGQASLRGSWPIAGIPSGTAEIRDVDLDDWLRQCVPQFKAHSFPGAVPFNPNTVSIHYSNYYLLAESSGLCADALSCAFEHCKWSNSSSQTLMSHDLERASFHDLQQYFPPVNLPSKIAIPRSVQDLVAVVKFASMSNTPISIKSGGHSYVGSSTMKGSILINLHKFPKYSHSSIMECNGEHASTNACELALARGKHAVARVGGGELWNDVYTAVIDWNTAMPRKRKYDHLGGGAGTVSAAGGWLQGGGLGLGQERLWGLGVDQVLELEMVLVNGTHVRFGPTKWKNTKGFLYPQTTLVEGKCNVNVHDDEAQWQWKDCEKHIAFDKLWFAVRGGGGGSYGVVTAVHYQLHDFETWYAIETVSETLESVKAMCKEQGTCDAVAKLWVDFAIDFLYDPSSIGIDPETSNRCGESNPAFTLLKTGRLWWCRGDASHEMIEAWKSYAANATDFNVSSDMLHGLQNLLSERNANCYGRDVITGAVKDVDSFVPIGNMPDDDGASTIPMTTGTWSVLVPTAWILSRSAAVYETLMGISSRSGKVHVMGGNVAVSSDGMTAISKPERGAAFQFNMPTNMGDWGDMQEEFELLEARIREWLLPYQTSDDGKTFLGGTEYNHISPQVVGPLRSNWTSPCPRDLTRDERSKQCMSLQEAVWGPDMLSQLESVKGAFDPKNLFKCFFCVANRDVPDKP